MVHNVITKVSLLSLLLTASLSIAATYPDINMDPQPLRLDTSVTYDYTIAAVITQREHDCIGCPQTSKKPSRWAEFANPAGVSPSDLIVIKPDGTYTTLVQGGEGAIQDLKMSFDGLWIYYTLFYKATGVVNKEGSDIYKVHVQTREVVQLTTQQWAQHITDIPKNHGVYNMHPCPLPDGSLMYVSNRNTYMPPQNSYPRWAWQLTRRYDNGEVETIGHMNLGTALHPVVLTTGEVMFSTLESMGNRRGILWGIWKAWPDGTKWGPVVSAFAKANGWHFQTELGNAAKEIVANFYYNQNQHGFGRLFALPQVLPSGTVKFGPADIKDVRNPLYQGVPGVKDTFPFTPTNMRSVTNFTNSEDRPSLPSIADDPTSPRVGKVTHPSAAPDGHLLVVWTPGPIGGSSGTVKDFMMPTPIHSGIYLIKDAAAINAPGDMLEVLKVDDYNLQWPTPIVPYSRIYNIEKPVILPDTRDKTVDYGYVGTSTLYKRESAPLGKVVGVTSTTIQRWGPPSNVPEWNLTSQGADRGRYNNSEIQSIRIVGFIENEFHNVNTPGSVDKNYPPYYNQISERLEDWGAFTVRKDDATIVDSDGNPDTSFLVKIPCNRSFTFQTLDKDGLVLNMAETWHQVACGTTENQCGGCHSHSQKPTPFEGTAASKSTYTPFEAQQAVMPEWYTHVAPLINAKCTSCHTTWGDNTRPPTDIKDASNKVIYPAGRPKGYTDIIKYAKPLQGRFSRMMQVLFNKRLDGMTFTDSSIADYVPPSQDHTTVVTPDERRAILDWIELGMTICLASDTTSCTKRR